MNKKLIACDLHDYFEIACMYRLEVLFKTQDGQSLQGRAQDIVSKNGRECLVLENCKEAIEISSLKSIKAVKDNPHFDEIRLEC